MNLYRFLLFLFLIVSLGNLRGQSTSDIIRLNQIGYHTEGVKMADISSSVEEKVFRIKNSNGDVVFNGNISGSKFDKLSGENISQIDFSGLKEQGTFILELNDSIQSYPFKIGTDLFTEPLKATLKSYYFWRSGTDLKSEYAGRWQRKGGHADSVVYIHPSAATKWAPSNSVISSPGGWYDAGDYNKYVVNSAVSVSSLLSAYEYYPQYLDTLNLSIPESGNNMPDILNEVLSTLRWMLTMQDPHDGGVYHKLTTAKFAPQIMPEKCSGIKRYVVQKSVSATLDFSAVMAQAARVYKNALPLFADSVLFAANKAWFWAKNNPDITYSQQKLNSDYDPDINTGAYGDKSVEDEFAWAAAELFVTTGRDEFLKKVIDYYSSLFQYEIPGWRTVGMYGLYSLLNYKKEFSKEVNNEIALWKKGFLKRAMDMVSYAKRSPTSSLVGYEGRKLVWGSNAALANRGMLLLVAYKITGDHTYYETARSCMDYIMGKNATGYCFVTGLGNKSPMHPHHRISEADGIEEPVPGMLVGGPTSANVLSCNFPSEFPAKRYVDNSKCYSCNEVAINWNAPLIFLLAGVVAGL
jgi:endoglucanase